MTAGGAPLAGRRAAVVGAGIAGLAAAFRLRQAGAEVLVLERSDHVGGRMSTLRVDGFTIDLGAGLLSYSYREMLALIDDAGLTGMVEPTGGLLGIVHDGQTYRFRSYRELFAGNLLSEQSQAAFRQAVRDARAYQDLFDWADLGRAARLDAEDILSYAERRFPAELIEYVIEPICHDIWLSSPHRLSVANLLFYLCRLSGKGFFSSPAGVGFLPAGLAGKLPVRTSATVTGVEPRGAGAVVTWRTAGGPDRVDEFDAAVVAVPAPHVAGLCPWLPPADRELLAGITHVRGIEVHVGLDRPPAEPAMWVQLGRSHPDLAALVMDHHKAPGRAPAGRGLVSSYWRPEWSGKRWDSDDDSIAADALAVLDARYPGLSEQVVFTRVQRWDPCVVTHRPGGIRNLRRLARNLDPRSSVQFAGDYLAMSTTNSSLCAGERAARRVLSRLSARAAPRREEAVPE